MNEWTVQRFKFLDKFRKEVLKKKKKNTLAWAKHFTNHASNSMWEVLHWRLRQAKHMHCALHLPRLEFLHILFTYQPCS